MLHNPCPHWTDCCVVPVFLAEFLRLLPFGVLHRLFAHSTTTHAITSSNSTTAGGAAPPHHYGSPQGSPTASTTGLHSVGSLDSFAHGDTAGTATTSQLFVILCALRRLQVCWERDHCDVSHHTRNSTVPVSCVLRVLSTLIVLDRHCYSQVGSG
jgi:hypothetical protein